MGSLTVLSRRVSFSALLGAAVVLAGAPADARPVRLAAKARLSDDSGATDAVRRECGLQTNLPEYVREASRDVELVHGKRPRRGRVLELKIEDVHARGGGPFSGGRSMTVSVELWERGRVVASARAKRRSSAVPFAGGTCSQLNRIARAIGRDIGHWLEDPRRDSHLGD